MRSRVVYSHEFSREIDQGRLAPENFDYHFLCEGDSWMDRSAPWQLSLPWALAKTFHGDRGDRALFINLSRFGHTLRHIGDTLNQDFLMWLTTDMGWRFDALLFSAGGNDFIDAALGPDPGAGILRDVREAGADLTADECFDADAVGLLVTDYLDPNFDKLYRTVRGSPLHGDMPILLNCYNAPVARNAPAYPGGKAWLSRAYRKNGIPSRLWSEVTDRLFVDVEAAVTGWTRNDRLEVYAVPTSAVPLVPADETSAGDSGDWVNEIHPNATGWSKLAKVWQEVLDEHLLQTA